MNRSLGTLFATGVMLAVSLAGRVAGQTYYSADLHDHHAHHLNHGATGAAQLELDADRTHLKYRISLDGLTLKPNAADRTDPTDVIGIHMHLFVPDTVGPHVLNIFGLATYSMPAEEDADLVVDYVNQTLSGIYDYSDATIDPDTGEPFLPFFPLTTKVIDDWLDELDAGALMIAVHTVATGFPTMAVHGNIVPVPEPMTSVLVVLAIGWVPHLRRRRPTLVEQRLPPRWG